jgi:hypothetical protein
MFKVNAYVTEIETNNLYEVDIDGFKIAVATCVGNDDDVVTFESALIRVLEFKYGDCDFDYVFRSGCNGYRMYDVEVIDDPVYE